jgi:hypothetical protein
MKNLSYLLIISFVVFTLSACKKETIHAPISILGKWYVKSYIETHYINGVADTILNFSLSKPDTSLYIQFFNDGRGYEPANNFIVNFFNYKVSGSSLLLDGPLIHIQAISTITKPDVNNLTLKGSNGNVVKELHLMYEF